MNKILSLSDKDQLYLSKFMPEDTTLQKLANFFEIFSDYTRVKILTALSIRDMCVNDMSIMLNINQTTLSHQLKYLRQCDAVSTVRDGKIIYYRLQSNIINDVMMDGVDYLLAE